MKNPKQKKGEVYIPTELLNTVVNKIGIHYTELNEVGRLKLTERIITLWMYIYNEQQKDTDHTDLRFYSNIHKSDLEKFDIMINKKRYRYYDLIDFLKQYNLISVNEKYSQSKYTKGYRIETEFINNTYTSIFVDYNLLFENIKNKTYWKRKYKNHHTHIDNTYNVSVDLEPFINYLYENEGMELTPIYRAGKLIKRTLTKERILRYINDAVFINHKVLWFAVSEEGRFYNSLTNLTSTAKQFFILKRRKVVELDITNCQPLLLNIIVKNNKFKWDCEQGLLYNVLSEVMNIPRSQVKIMTYKYIFFGSKPLKSGKLYESMEKIYPGLIEQINNLKTKDINLARQLQKIEADIFVNYLAELGYDNILRHDSIFVYENDREDMITYIEASFNNLGLKVKIN